MFRCFARRDYASSCSSVLPACAAYAFVTARDAPAFFSSSKRTNSHSLLVKRRPIHGSAPSNRANVNNPCTCSSSRYWVSCLVLLHSIASTRAPFPAMTSGKGYFITPLPATRHAAQLCFQNKCTSSRSAAIPFATCFSLLGSLAAKAFFPKNSK